MGLFSHKLRGSFFKEKAVPHEIGCLLFISSHWVSFHMYALGRFHIYSLGLFSYVLIGSTLETKQCLRMLEVHVTIAS